jgi:Ca2+-transporting ATPase
LRISTNEFAAFVGSETEITLLQFSKDLSEVVTTCHHAGVTIKMSTRDNVLTARSIASAVSTLLGVSSLEGSVFCAPEPDERVEVISCLRVLAQSSPEDEKVRTETHRDLGEIVGVTTVV